MTKLHSHYSNSNKVVPYFGDTHCIKDSPMYGNTEVLNRGKYNSYNEVCQLSVKSSKDHDKVEVVNMTANKYWLYVKTFNSKDQNSIPVFMWVEVGHFEICIGRSQPPHLSPFLFQNNFVFAPCVPLSKDGEQEIEFKVLKNRFDSKYDLDKFYAI